VIVPLQADLWIAMTTDRCHGARLSRPVDGGGGLRRRSSRSLGVALYRTILTAAERPRVFLKVTLAMLPLNAVANWVLMTGAGPIPALGPTGRRHLVAARRIASLALLVLIARRSTAAGRAPRRMAIEPRRVTVILRVGLPIGIATVAEVGVFLGATLYAARLGAADAAAHTLTLRTAGLAYAVPVAILQASMVRMARAERCAAPSPLRASRCHSASALASAR
jgi:multidrug resistance protein, MATE family